MPTVRDSALESATARLKLQNQKKPYWRRVAPGISLGYRRNAVGGTWSVRGRDAIGHQWMRAFAIADDHEKSDGARVLTFFQAARVAVDIGRRGPASVGAGGSASMEQQIAARAAGFIGEPACYLYRHYDAGGDLLYVGITLSPLQRHAKHFAVSPHRYQIFKVLIEPFASRADALQAEELAIREEFPKFNARHNGRRHPLLEMKQLDEGA
jgi:hypothetical protein